MSLEPKATKSVRKAVIAAAGFGTRFLPQTKAMPKEMLPIVDKPIIQYIVEELVGAGIEDIVIVTGYSKRPIEDHFDYISADLRSNLKNAGKLELLETTKKISDLANFVYVRQKGRYGNGTPLLNVEHLIADEPFIFTFGDEFVKAKPNQYTQLINTYRKYSAPVLGSITATKAEDYNRYGFAAGEKLANGIIDVKQIIEKPGKKKAPSNLATVSGFLLTPEIFDYLKEAESQLGEKDEFYYNDALKLMLKNGKRLVACEIQNAKYYDTGNKLEYLKTVVDFALEREDLSGEFKKYLKEMIS